MNDTKAGQGFSLMEVLVALVVVSIAAANITGLQQVIAQQNRNNFVHSAVLKLATERMEEVLQYKLVADIDKLSELPAQRVIEPQTQTELMLKWHVAAPHAVYAAGVDVRDVQLQITWQGAQEETQSFTYSEQVNLAQLLNPQNAQAAAQAAIVESFFKSSELLYFESKMGYKKGAFVIYNSELFKATTVHAAGNGHPRDLAAPTVVADGWKSYGLIDDPALADNPELAALF